MNKEVLGMVKKKILASFFDINFQIFLTMFAMVNLPVEDGGLGLLHFADISKAAYFASAMAFDRTVLNSAISKKSFPEDNSFALGVCDLISVFLRGRDIHIGFEGPMSFKSNISILVWERKASIRSLLANQAVSGPDLSKWYESICNSTAGSWLLAIPAYSKMRMTSDRFVMALRYRYYLPQDSIGSGLKCSCLATVDTQGHHLITQCSKGSIRHSLHRAMVQEFAVIAQYCGIWTKMEERDVFRAADPDCNLRPDVSLIQPPKSSKERLLLDISVTHPSLGNSNSSAAEIRIRQKNAKYGDISIRSNCDFLPVVFDSSGALHYSAKLFLERLAKHASCARRIPWPTLLQFFEKRIAITFQNCLTGDLRKRLVNLHSHSSDHAISEMEILEC